MRGWGGGREGGGGGGKCHGQPLMKGLAGTIVR